MKLDVEDEAASGRWVQVEAYGGGWGVRKAGFALGDLIRGYSWACHRRKTDSGEGCTGAWTHGVMRASPVGQRTPGLISGTALHASSSSGPAALWMAVGQQSTCSMRQKWVLVMVVGCARMSWQEGLCVLAKVSLQPAAMACCPALPSHLRPRHHHPACAGSLQVYGCNQ